MMKGSVLWLLFGAAVILFLSALSWALILRRRLHAQRITLDGPVSEPKPFSEADCHGASEIPEALRDLFFARVLGGGYFPSEDALRATGRAVHAPFPYSKFIVVSVTIETWGEMFIKGDPNWKYLFFLLRNTFEHAYPGKTCAAEVKGRLIAIINFDGAHELSEIADDSRRALETLETEHGLTVTVAISRIYTDAMDLHKANQDVEHIIEYLAVMGEDYPVTTYDDLRHPNIRPSSKSFVDMESQLLSCVHAQDFTGMQNVLHELIFNEFSATKPTVDIFRFRVYGMVNTMLYIMDDIHDLVGGEVLSVIDPGPRLTGAETLDQIVQVMDDIVDQLRSMTSERQSASSPVWPEKVRSFVDEHFRDPNLTVSYAAAQCNLSSAYCSKLFRDQYNVRLFDYIQIKRLEAAKTLLDSNRNLKDIAEAVGFSSALTMSRAFKRYEGTTPGRFRDAESKSEE